MPSLRRTSPPPFLNLPLLILLLSIIAFLLFFLLIFPSFLSFSSHKLRPTIAVKKSWDSLNVFLVLFAILCGIFARRNDDDSASVGDGDNTTTNRNVIRSKDEETHSVSSNWFDQFSTSTPATVGGLRRLKRSSSSYPDLRQESLWETGDDRFRFFDDFEIRRYLSPPVSPEYVYHRRQRSLLEESNNVKEIPVDTFVLRSTSPSPVLAPPSPAPPTPPPPPPPPPPPARSNHRQRRTYQTVSRKEKVEQSYEKYPEFSEMENRSSRPPPPPPPPPPPHPPLSPPVTKGKRPERSHWKSERKKTNARKEIKMALMSLYHQSKRKKKHKTENLYDDSLDSSHEPTPFTVPPPPPPPPPPPSVFQSLFRKGSKNKRIYSYSTPPPPPPPPPRPTLSTSKRWSERKNHAPPPAPPPPPTPPRVHSRRRNSTTTGRPPLPTRVNNTYEENVDIGGQSPLIRMPPPPPPPPFKVPGFKFMVKGDYVKIRSAHSSRCSSPELDEVDKRSTKRVNVMEGGDGIGGLVSCPSPDVNVKADSFIARLRGEWRLEKINSWKEKRSMGLDMDSSPGPGPSTV